MQEWDRRGGESARVNAHVVAVGKLERPNGLQWLGTEPCGVVVEFSAYKSRTDSLEKASGEFVLSKLRYVATPYVDITSNLRKVEG